MDHSLEYRGTLNCCSTFDYVRPNPTLMNQATSVLDRKNLLQISSVDASHLASRAGFDTVPRMIGLQARSADFHGMW